MYNNTKTSSSQTCIKGGDIAINGTYSANSMLNKLKSYTPEGIVNTFNPKGIYPFDIESSIKSMGIVVIPYNFYDLEKKYGLEVKERGCILGSVIATKNKIAMFYRQGVSNNCKRFTLAHELAHCCIDLNLDKSRGRISHIEYRKTFEDNFDISPKEYNANVFAGEILIPEEPLGYVINNLISPTILNLSIFFGVSEGVMEERLRILGYNI